jgi:polysaccharide export outer membrane protein
MRPHRKINRTRRVSFFVALLLPFFGGFASDSKAQSAPASPAVRETGVPSTDKPKANPAPPVISKDDYIIGPEDVLAISVWRETELTRTLPVRPDGKISLPLIGDVKASGLTPRMLEAEIAKQLEAYVRKPEVAVIVQEAKSHKFNLMGSVARPGEYMLNSNMTVLDALALGGGFTDFAKRTKIYVLRHSPGSAGMVRLPFNYKQVIQGKSLDQNVELKPGDTIVVP